MKNLKIVAVLLALCVCLSGCNTWNNMSKTGQGAIIGTGGGAAVGSIIGAIAGNTAIGAVIGGAVGAGTGAIIGNRMDKVKKQAQQQLPEATVETVKDANNLDAVKVTFDSGILFATGKADLTASAKNSLAKFATVLKQNSDCDIAIQGYTDNQGFRGKTAAESQAMNKALSLDRASAVSNYLTGLAVSNSQIKSVEGFGEENPVADNSTAAGKAQNRRVEVYMYASQQMVNNATQQAQ